MVRFGRMVTFTNIGYGHFFRYIIKMLNDLVRFFKKTGIVWRIPKKNNYGLSSEELPIVAQAIKRNHDL